jgi:hypothetical protein
MGGEIKVERVALNAPERAGASDHALGATHSTSRKTRPAPRRARPLNQKLNVLVRVNDWPETMRQAATEPSGW